PTWWPDPPRQSEAATRAPGASTTAAPRPSCGSPREAHRFFTPRTQAVGTRCLAHLGHVAPAAQTFHAFGPRHGDGQRALVARRRTLAVRDGRLTDDEQRGELI